MEKIKKNNFMKIASFIFLLSVFLFICLNKFNNDPRLSYKYTYYAIPISISNTVGNDYSYTQFDNIRKNIINESHALERDELNQLINLSFTQQPTGAHAAAVPGAEDLGLVDFVTYSFFLFGNEKDSIFKFYLLIFITSFLIFFFQFKNKNEFYLFSISYLGALILFNENFIWHHPSVPTERFTDNRNFSLLGIIPYMHLSFYLFFEIKNKIRNIVLLTSQIIILNFIIFCRSSIVLEATIILSLIIILIILKYLKSNQNFSNFIKDFDNSFKVNLSVLLLFCLILMPNINKIFLKHVYSEFTGERHPTIVMLRAGLMFDNPKLKKKYDFVFNNTQMNIDLAINDSGLKFYNEFYNKNNNKKEIFFPSGGVNIVEQRKMEISFIIHLILNDSLELIKNFVYYKPLAIFNAFKTEMQNYETETNFLKVLVFMTIFFIFLLLKIKIMISIKLFLLTIAPVTIKNLLFWGLAHVYFFDLFIIYICGGLLLIYILTYLFKKLIIKKIIKNDSIAH